MPVSTVEIYERLKSHLGEEDTKALLSYVEETVSRAAVTKEDLLETQQTLWGETQGLRGEMQARFEKVEGEIASIKGEIAVIKATMATKEDIHQMQVLVKDTTHQLRVLLIVIIAVVVLLNPKVWEVIGNIFGVVK